VSIHSFVEWLDTFSYVLRPADVTVKEVNHIRRFAKDRILLSCRLAMIDNRTIVFLLLVNMSFYPLRIHWSELRYLDLH
jgi:hypothetical protein